MMRPQGLFAMQGAAAEHSHARDTPHAPTSDLLHRSRCELDRASSSLRAPAARRAAAVARRLPAEPGRQVPDLRLRRARPGDVLGLRRRAQPGPGRVLRPRRLLHGDVPQARGLRPDRAPRSSRRPASPTSWTGTRSPQLPLFWLPFKSLPFTLLAIVAGARRCSPSSSAARCSSAAWAACTSPSSRRRSR